MKKNILLSLGFSLCYSFLSAQQAYIPMLKPNHQWAISYQNFMISNTYPLKLGKDSIINGVKYVNVDNDFLREDSSEAKVYINKYGKEQVLYDFNLKVGDKITYTQNCYYTIKEISMIKLLDGSPRVKYSLVRGLSGFVNTYWIMGIGSSKGPNFPPFFGCATDPSYQLSSFKINDKYIYNSNLLPTSDIPDFESVKIYPNPLDEDILKIDFPVSVEISNLTVYDAFGKSYFSKKNLNQESSIDFHFLPKGIYFLHFEDTKGRKSVKKLLKL
jgi:hypothetical protein